MTWLVALAVVGVLISSTVIFFRRPGLKKIMPPGIPASPLMSWPPITAAAHCWRGVGIGAKVVQESVAGL